MADRRAARLTGWDLAGMLAGLLYPFVIVIVNARDRIFWEDEMLGWMLLHDPSWHHMLTAYNQGADGGGFLFYLLGRGWFHLFGPAALSFRLLSATCFGLALVASWAALRRFYSTGIVAFALFNTWFFSPPFVAHMAEGRFYGLLVLGVSLAMWLALVLAEAPRPTPRRFYAAMFLAHAVLATGHLLGVVFSAFLIGSVAVLDWLRDRPHPLLYLAGVASWLLLLPERANIVASARVGKPHFWTKAPRLFDIFSVYTGSSKEIALVLGVLLVVLMLGIGHGRASRWAVLRTGWRARRPVYVVAGAMLLLGVAFLLEGPVGIWLFNDRYLLPMTVAIAYLTAELAQLGATSFYSVSQGTPRRSLLVGSFGVIFAMALVLWDFKHLANFSPSPRDYTSALTALLPKGVPVVCEDAFTFTELMGRQRGSGVRYLFLLDWQQSLSSSAPRLEVTQYHLMENWRKVGYFANAIEPVNEFLQANNKFLVVHAGPFPPTNLPPEIGNPLAERLAHTPGYEVKPYAQMDAAQKRYSMWLVCKRTCKQ